MDQNPKTTAFDCLWYVCPKCQTENTVRLLDNPLVKRGFRCKGCKTTFHVGELLQHYMGEREKLNFLAAEFMCDRCGEVNVVFTRITHNAEVEKEPDQPWEPSTRLVFEGGQAPKFGLCENCGAGYELMYPVPPHVIRLAKDKGVDLPEEI